MKIVVSGATGFIGHYVCEELVKRGHQVIGLSRDGAKSKAASGIDLGLLEKVDYQKADVSKNEGLSTIFANTDAVIHLVGIIEENKDQTFIKIHVEGTNNVLKAVKEAGVKRYLHMSALGARADSPSNYAKTKFQAEELVKGSGLDWTIFRPSLVFGPGDDFFGRVLKNLVSTGPIVPVIGSGKFPFRPVFVEDVASVFVQALEKPETIDQTYELVGQKQYSLEELLDLVLKALNKNKHKLHIPVSLMNLIVPILSVLPKPPITKDQYAMLLEGNTADPSQMMAVFSVKNPSLETSMAEIL